MVLGRSWLSTRLSQVSHKRKQVGDALCPSPCSLSGACNGELDYLAPISLAWEVSKGNLSP